MYLNLKAFKRGAELKRSTKLNVDLTSDLNSSCDCVGFVLVRKEILLKSKYKKLSTYRKREIPKTFLAIYSIFIPNILTLLNNREKVQHF